MPPREPSGRFLLRISSGLHGALRRAAEEANLSLNDYCSRKLAAPVGVGGPGATVVARAAEQFGENLVGVLVFGSWARGETVEQSDVDLLVIVGADVPIVRSLYHAWDAAAPTWEGRRLEVHFVHLPDVGEGPSGLWAEAALDGLVLFDRDFELSRRLIEIRKQIAAGAVRRRRAHGQPYWVAGG